jgi:hypothetical protein
MVLLWPRRRCLEGYNLAANLGVRSERLSAFDCGFIRSMQHNKDAKAEILARKLGTVFDRRQMVRVTFEGHPLCIK